MSVELVVGADREEIEARQDRPTAGRRPALVCEVELSQPLVPISSYAADRGRYREVWLVAKVFGEPVGLVPVPFDGDCVSVTEVAAAIDAACGDLVRARVRACGGNADAALAGLGTTPSAVPAFTRAHALWLRCGPSITVVICTRNRAHDLARALDSVLAQSYQRFDVLIVDNAPSDDSTESLVRRLSESDVRIRYSREQRPGLSWARNHALAQPLSQVVAWLDDDEVADGHWLMELAGGFCTVAGAAAVSGSVVPAELETEPQLWFEQYGGHTKGRGFHSAVFRGDDPDGQSPVYPLPAFGVGANMAFSVAALQAIGGFDTALGAGTATLGGEDTLAFSQILLGGGTVLYRPSALTRHYHRPDYEALSRQMRGYGMGLTAYYLSLLRHDWKLALPLLRLAPRAIKDVLGADGERLAGVPATFPRELLKLKTRGMLAGPLAYVRACRHARRLADGGQALQDRR